MRQRATIDPLTAQRAEKPVRYSFPKRLADRHGGAVDGKAHLLCSWLDDTPDRAASSAEEPRALTPYLGAIDHEFRTQADQVHLDAEAELRPAVARRETVRRLIGPAEERVRAARKKLDEFGESPGAERLSHRSAAEAHQADQVITGRNQRRFDAERAPLLAAEVRALAEVEALRREWAELTGGIVTRRAVAVIRASRLHNHALRRCRTYERRLVLRHDRGAQLVPLLSVNRPQPPEWTADWGALTGNDELPTSI